LFSNGRWAKEQGFSFPILSDFWPHGEVARTYGCFDETLGAAKRYTYVLDADAIVREIVKSDELSQPRPHDAYYESLAAI
jgi:peroxiredoxin